jgi:hypothetical protein
MDFTALNHASFKLLDDAVTDWSTLVRHLEDLKKDAEGNICTRPPTPPTGPV